MNIYNDSRIVLTLDAGGTNFVFSAIRSGKELIEPVNKPSNAHDLKLCLTTIVDGFKEINEKTNHEAVAISFAFPGPADYPKGIIGDLNNLPAFRDGIALADYLKQYFDLPVFINNDGDLYAYGEAIGGMLADINSKLKSGGSTRQYKNLIGLTLGTGFGGGIVSNGNLLIGDNSIAAEVWAMSNRIEPSVNAEEGISTRSVVSNYVRMADIKGGKNLMPKDIYEIATGSKEGDMKAAVMAFESMGTFLGDVIANLLTLIDGIIVIGGGITGAKDLYMPAVLKEINSEFEPQEGSPFKRLTQQVFCLDNPEEEKGFYTSHIKEIKVPFSEKTVLYEPEPKLAIATSKMGANKAISLGAYAFAINNLKY